MPVELGSIFSGLIIVNRQYIKKIFDTLVVCCSVLSEKCFPHGLGYGAIQKEFQTIYK